MSSSTWGPSVYEFRRLTRIASDDGSMPVSIAGVSLVLFLLFEARRG